MNDWNTSIDPVWMLWHVDRSISERKRRLLASAFCRHINRLLTKVRCRKLLTQAKNLSVFRGESAPCKPDFLLLALEDLDRCADDLASIETLATVAELAEQIGSFTCEYYYACYDESWGRFDHNLIATCESAEAVSQASRSRLDLEQVAAHAARAVYRAKGGSEQKVGDPDEAAAQCALIRDLFPRHPRLVALNPSWLTSTVVALARGIYDDRAFDRMPILADALQDAGCDNEDVLTHCRDEKQVHVRGCWVVDLLLGKE